MNTPTIKTDRLILRKFLENDIEALFLILKDKEVNKFLPWYSLKDIEETKKFYAERYAAKYKKQYSLPCFTTTEQDIIDKLESVPNKAGYIKSLIRADIAASKKTK